jgi:hypothetical protein
LQKINEGWIKIGLIMKQNMIISIVIVVAVCLVVIFFAVGYSRMLQPASKPVAPTPVVTQPVVQPTEMTIIPTPIPTSQTDWVGYIQQGTTNIELGKSAIVAGKAKMDPVLGVQGQYPDVITILYSAQGNFTNAKGYFRQAQADFSNAAVTAPPSQQDTLSKTASTIGSDITSTDLYIQSTQLGLVNEWWNANNAYNQANLHYEASIQSTNNLLNSMNILAT